MAEYRVVCIFCYINAPDNGHLILKRSYEYMQTRWQIRGNITLLAEYRSVLASYMPNLLHFIAITILDHEAFGYVSFSIPYLVHVSSWILSFLAYFPSLRKKVGIWVRHAVSPLSTFEPVKLFSRNLVWTLYNWRAPQLQIFFLVSYSQQWQHGGRTNLGGESENSTT
jgi:hypothetical protein